MEPEKTKTTLHGFDCEVHLKKNNYFEKDIATSSSGVVSKMPVCREENEEREEGNNDPENDTEDTKKADDNLELDKTETDSVPEVSDEVQDEDMEGLEVLSLQSSDFYSDHDIYDFTNDADDEYEHECVDEEYETSPWDTPGSY